MTARTMTAKGEAGWLALLVLGLLVLLGVALYPRPLATPPQSKSSALQPPAPETRDGARGQPSTPASAPLSAALPPELEQRRQRVLAALEQSQPASVAREPGTNGARQASPAFPEDEAIIERAVMPLAEACYEQSRERGSRLAGTLALNVTLAHAAGIGGVIESVEAGPANQLHDEALLECVRQAAYGLELPATAQGGRSHRSASLQIRPPPGTAPTEP